jgi:hypothetical protein
MQHHVLAGKRAVDRHGEAVAVQVECRVLRSEPIQQSANVAGFGHV